MKVRNYDLFDKNTGKYDFFFDFKFIKILVKMVVVAL